MSTSAARAKINIPSPETAADRQRFEDKRSRLACASGVQYQADADVIALNMRSGITINIPRRLIDELTDASQATLKNELALGIAGDALSVSSLDVDISVSGLLRDLLGFNIQRMGGKVRSEAKAAASRANGIKGGRPQKKRAA